MLAHLLIALMAVALQDEPSPGAVPTPEVAEATISDARPNFDNPGELAAFVDGVVATHLANDHVAGATLAIVRGGRTVLLRGYGIAAPDGTPVDPARTLFRIGSISKTFTWVAILQHAEAGRLSLDDPVNDHLPEALYMSARGGEPVRIRHLMTHTPGLEDSALGHLFARTPEDVLPLADYLATYVPRQVRPAGETAVYSNYGAALAGLIAARLAGSDFETLVESAIYGPLGMRRSSFREPVPDALARERGLPLPMSPVLADEVAQRFAWKNGGFEPRGFEYISGIGPAGAMSSTAADMALWMQALLGGGANAQGRILPETMAAALRETLFANGEGVPGIAHGLLEYDLPGGFRGIGHGGATLGFQSNMVLVPELDLGIFVSTDTPTGFKLVYDLPQRLIAEFFAPARKLPAADPELVARAGQLAGQYLPMRRNHGAIEGLLALPGIAAVSVDPEGWLLVTQGGETTRYGALGGNIFREVEGSRKIGFRTDDSGRATHLLDSFGIMPMERIGFFGGATWFSLILSAAAAGGIGALVGAWLRRRREIAQTPGESWAGRLMPALGAAWLLFLLAATLAIAGLSQDTEQAIFAYPGGAVKLMAWLAFLAGLLTLGGLAGLVPVWRSRSWPLWRRLRHSALVLVSLAATLTLLHWNVIGFSYI